MSPVIGAILMVAITVFPAAVIGSFVLGIGWDVETTPQASIQANGGNLTHAGGAELPGDNAVLEWTGPSGDAALDQGTTGSYTTGDVIVNETNGRLVWKSNSSDKSAVLYDGT